jgi:hypothetical protein
MKPEDYFELLASNPRVLLALSLSAPAESYSLIRKQKLELEIGDGEITIRSPSRETRFQRNTWLVCNKGSICLAILLHRLWRSRGGSKSESYLIQSLTSYADELANLIVTYQSKSPLRSTFFPNATFPEPQHLLMSRLEISDGLLNEVDEECLGIFQKLEQEGLAIDPGFTPELMVLVGLVPMQFSVRTPQGEDVIRRISIKAPLWRLEIDRIKRGRKMINDWQFEMRGVNFVRSVIKTLAEQYITSENEARQESKQPYLPAPDNIMLDPSGE